MFLDKSEQPWPGGSHVKERAKGSILFACLLVLLAGRPCFRFVIGLADLTVGLAIGRAKSTGRGVAIGFSG